MAGRFARPKCKWDILARISAAAVIASTLIVGWKIIRLHPDAGDEITLHCGALTAASVAILILCVGR